MNDPEVPRSGPAPLVPLASENRSRFWTKMAARLPWSQDWALRNTAQREGPPQGALIASVIVAIVLMAMPFWLGLGTIRVLTTVFMFGTLAASWNLLGGLAGYISFGHVVFFGIGSYAAAVCMLDLHLTFAAALPASGVMAILFALIVSPVLRLRGHYFAIISYGVAEATREVINNLRFTGGGKGLSLPLLAWDVRTSSLYFYFSMLALLILIVAMTYILIGSRLGYALKAIRADEEAAAVMGINTARSKVLVFMASAFVAGLVGGLYARWVAYIDPVTVFDPLISVTTIIMTFIGGAGTILGPVIGAFVIHFVGDLLLGQFIELHTTIFGTLIILAVLFVPRGMTQMMSREGLRLVLRPRLFLESLAKYRV